MTELASAYVTLIPSLQGAQRQIQRELGGVDVNAAGSRLGDQLSGSIGRSLNLEVIGRRFQEIGGYIQGAGQKLTRWITLPAVGAATAVGGIATALGFRRLVALDTARAQFEGLGYDVEAVMAQVDAGVTDTALSMQEGAGVAVGALAANVPLDQLEDHIRRVANVTAAYGVEASHAGLLINQAYIDQGVSWGLLSQMQQNQIPIVSALADMYGVTGAEVRDMASSGEIAIEDLNRALDLSAGSAAESYASSWRGITSNIVANVGRVAATVLEGAFPIAKDALSDFLEVLRSDEASEWAAAMGQSLGEGFERVIDAIRTTIDWWQGLSDTTKTFLVTLAGVAVAAGPFLIVIGKIVTAFGGFLTALAAIKPLLAVLAGPIGLIVAAVAALTAGLVWFFTQTELGQQIWETVWDAIQVAVEWAADALAVAWEWIQAGAEALFTWFQNTALPAMQAVWDGITETATAAAGWYMEHVWPMFEAFGDLLSALWERIEQAAGRLWVVLEPIFGFIAAAWSVLWFGVQSVWQTVGPAIISAIQTGWQNLRTATETVWNIIKTAIETVLGVIQGVIRTVTAIIRGDWRGAWNEIKGIAETIWNGIRTSVHTAIDGVRAVISNTLTTIRGIWDTAWGTIVRRLTDAWNNITSAVAGGVSDAISTIRELPGRARDALSNIGSALLNAGRQLISGFIDGIRERFNSVRDTLSGLTDMLPSWKGPASRDRNLLTPAGNMIIEGFVDGLEEMYPEVRKSLLGLTDEVAGMHMQAPTPDYVPASWSAGTRPIGAGVRSGAAFAGADDGSGVGHLTVKVEATSSNLAEEIAKKSTQRIHDYVASSIGAGVNP